MVPPHLSGLSLPLTVHPTLSRLAPDDHDDNSDGLPPMNDTGDVPNPPVVPMQPQRPARADAVVVLPDVSLGDLDDGSSDADYCDDSLEDDSDSSVDSDSDDNGADHEDNEVDYKGNPDKVGGEDAGRTNKPRTLTGLTIRLPYFLPKRSVCKTLKEEGADEEDDSVDKKPVKDLVVRLPSYLPKRAISASEKKVNVKVEVGPETLLTITIPRRLPTRPCKREDEEVAIKVEDKDEDPPYKSLIPAIRTMTPPRLPHSSPPLPTPPPSLNPLEDSRGTDRDAQPRHLKRSRPWKLR